MAQKKVAALSREQRLALLEHKDSELSLRRQSGLLGLNRTALYYRPVAPSPEEVALKHRIDEIYTRYPFYGIRRITAVLRQEGRLVNHKAVARHMREMGLAAIYPGPNLSKRAAQHAVYPYLLRGVLPSQPDAVWSIDITYIRLRSSWMYLVAVIDWYSRYIVSYELDQTLALPFVLAAMRSALASGKPAIWNSDQGSHFTSEQYIGLLREAGVRISMDGRGRALDNIPIERFWRSLKYEEVYLHEYDSPRQARSGISSYIDFYNQTRPHQALGYQPPAQLYCSRKVG